MSRGRCLLYLVLGRLLFFYLLSYVHDQSAVIAIATVRRRGMKEISRMFKFSVRYGRKLISVALLKSFNSSSYLPRSFILGGTTRCKDAPRYFSSAAKTIDELLEDAKGGDANCIAEVGKYYLDKGDLTAQTWLKIACDLGHSEAPFLLGVMLVENPSSGCDEALSPVTVELDDSPASRRDAVLKEIKDATQTARTARKMRMQLKRKKALATNGTEEIIISNYELGLEYLRMSCRQNNGRALCYLGNILLSKDTNDDVTEGMLLYEKASNLIPAQRDALFNLGSLYFHGRDGMLNADLSKSFEYYKRAADLGDVASKFWVGYSYATGDNGAKDKVNDISINPELALKYLLSCDADDHGYGLFILSTLYRSGLKASDGNGNIIESYKYNIEQNKELFIKYLMRSVELDDSSGLNALGRLYLNISESEDYFPKDEEKGVDLLIRASAGGEAEASYTLGAIHYNALYGMKKDPRKAFEFYNIAAEQGSSDAWKNLAAMYMIGDGIPKSEETAKEIMRVMFKKEN